MGAGNFISVGFLTAACAWIGPFAFGQTAEVRAIDAAAAALGGKARILALKTWVMEGSGVNPNIGQNPRPEAPLNNWHVLEYNRSFDLANGRMRIEQHRIADFESVSATDVRRTFGIDGDVAYNIGPNGAMQRAAAEATAERRIEMLTTPITAIRAALNIANKIENYRKTQTTQYIDITTVLGDKLVLAIDAKTNLPQSVSWKTSNENLGDVLFTTTFSDYENVDGVRVPTHYLTTMNFRSWVIADMHITKNTIDGETGDISASAAVKGSPVPPPPVIRVEAQPVAKGIWWMAGSGDARSILFEFDDHLTLFEAPTSEARSKAVIDKARETVPNKPLTEVIVSHHHFDHTGGLRTAVAEGLTVISHLGNEAIFREMTSRPATVKPDLLASSGQRLTFRGMDDQLILKDRSMEVVLYQVKDNPHAALLIMAFVPRDNILVQGDLMDVSWTQHPWASNYAKNLEMRKIDFAKDLPVHGKIASHAEELAALQGMKKN